MVQQLVGTGASLHFTLDKLHFFDPDGGDSLDRKHDAG